MDEKLKNQLKKLAQKYEVCSFTQTDPSQFLCWYNKNEICNVECAAFISAMLSFGKREQFIPKIQYILNLADKEGGISNWILSDYKTFPEGENKFYRFYSYNDLRTLFCEIKQILLQDKTLGDFFKNKYSNRQNQDKLLSDIISESFPESKIVPKGKNSANKRIHMFLRWMVRQNSPVDLGLWNWYPQKNLLIPLDVHVLEEAKNLNLIPEKAPASKKTAILLSKTLEEVFPDDPSCGDYALFGVGVDNSEN